MGSDVGKALGAAMTLGTSYVIDEAFLAPGRRMARAAEDEARAGKEARAVSAAQDQAERTLAIRQQARQDRVRRAQIIAAGEASGLEGSSAESGTMASNVQTSAANSAFATGASITASTLTSLNQQMADAQQRGNEAQAKGQLYKTVFDLGMQGAKMAAGMPPSVPTGGVTSSQPASLYTPGASKVRHTVSNELIA